MAQVGYAYLANGRTLEAADWRDHPDAEGWMLNNVAIALRSVDRDVDALDASLTALQRKGDNSTATHALWVCLEDAILRQPEQAASRLATVSASVLPDFEKTMHALALAAVETQLAPESKRRSVFESHRKRLLESRANLAAPMLRPTAERAVAVMAAAACEKPFSIASGWSGLSVQQRSLWTRGGVVGFVCLVMTIKFVGSRDRDTSTCHSALTAGETREFQWVSPGASLSKSPPTPTPTADVRRIELQIPSFPRQLVLPPVSPRPAPQR